MCSLLPHILWEGATVKVARFRDDKDGKEFPRRHRCVQSNHANLNLAGAGVANYLPRRSHDHSARLDRAAVRRVAATEFAACAGK
jgi:hypothetical protein